jgi:hypothetical protein
VQVKKRRLIRELTRAQRAVRNTIFPDRMPLLALNSTLTFDGIR